MSVLDKIRGLNQLHAKCLVLKRILPGFTACWHAQRPWQHHPETLGLIVGHVQTSEIKIIAYPDFPYAVRVWTPIPLQFQSSLLIKYLYPTGKSLYKQHLSQSTGITRGFQMCCDFFGCKMLTLYSYPPPVPYRNALILPLSCYTVIYTYAHLAAILINSCTIQLVKNTSHLIVQKWQIQKWSKLSCNLTTSSIGLTKAFVMFNSLMLKKYKILGGVAVDILGIERLFST